MKIVTLLLLVLFAGCNSAYKGTQPIDHIGGPKVLDIPYKTFGLNYSMELNSESEVDTINLYMSENNGNTWSIYNAYPASLKVLPVKVESEGRYSFFTQAIGKKFSEPPPENGTQPKIIANVKLPSPKL